MRDIFLGKPWHWLLLAIVAALLWWAGIMKMHVIEFNGFFSLLLIGSLVTILLLLRTTRPDEQVTREALELFDQDKAGPT